MDTTKDNDKPYLTDSDKKRAARIELFPVLSN